MSEQSERKEKKIMKIQNLAIIFIIIILPISLVFATYTKNRIETINLQSNYDSKLNDATHDALKAYQLNSFSSDTADYTNSKIRDIKASVNTFFNSLSTNFNTLGYTKETLQNYVPAIVYTMYDGYYIYSPFTNTWNTQDANGNLRDDSIGKEMTQQIVPGNQGTYSDNTITYGLKPYVYYSCRYKKDSDNDIIITYSLDNYIQIQGKIGGEVVSKYGYLLDYVEVTGNDVFYNGVQIDEEVLSENVYVDGGIGNYRYIKKNGTKYYLDNDNQTVFSVLKGKKIIQNKFNSFDSTEITENKSGKNYYKESKDLKEYILGKEFLRELSTEDIVDIDTGKKYTNDEENPYYKINKIFDFNNTNGIAIEEETSNFNTHRIDVIKNSIERNLSIAISNFNNYSGATTDFQMPRLKDSDWDKIMNNISVISFFQGAYIGGKVYNGYSIITNTKNEDVVMEDSIYMVKDNNIYDITDEELRTNYNGVVGVFNINTEPRVGDDESTYYMPVTGTLSYNSIITKNNISGSFKGNLGEYVKGLPPELKKAYYTALGRERYGLYRPKLEI